MEKKQTPSSYDLLQPVYVLPVHSVPYTQKSPAVYVSQLDAQSLTPNHFLVLSVVAVIALTILCPLTLAFTVPALLFSFLSRNASTQGRFLKAKRLGNIALALNFTALFVTFVTSCFIIILFILKFHHRHSYFGYGDCIYETIGSGSGAWELVACP